ncbi:Zinc finger C-x8-C-x5-C-x3-H type (and similar) family protein [Leishmania donovani]|uniref:Zinc finger C-x8-C-x5-C-x3-H type (And similar) family protein n=1 Tax=Leishmania donovani TaxID=5661 RepID=A0A504X4W4_LEIDO|nr:Zinc finger C-x8-C-x5-C-x3-H type (and similar) family protein [Leishmania donovani]
MTFSVKGGSYSSSHPSPAMHPYVSPSLLPQSHGQQAPPSFSLGDEQYVGVPKRVGVDPTKYKTTICRNWEQTGTCTFRGCTFAHGVEELRAPFRPDGHTPQLLDMLYKEVLHQRELVTVHVEANTTLEGMLRREQAQHDLSKKQLEEKTQQCELLARELFARNQQLRKAADSSPEIKGLLDQWETQLASFSEADAKKDDVFYTATATSSTDDGGDSGKEYESARIEELLRALQR